MSLSSYSVVERGFFHTVEEERTPVPVSSLRLNPQSTSKIFYSLILTISIIAGIANVAAIYSIINRKCKILQKTCIICLAIADIFSVIMFATNYLDSLKEELAIWKLGEFMCYFASMGQLLGTFVSSACLLIIAIDRYWNVIHAMSKRWDPGLLKCVLGAVLVWIVCAGVCFPTFTNFSYLPIYIEYTSNITEEAYMCISATKDNLKVYYTCMTVIIFLPMFITFTWLYYKIAALIWRHRKPVSSGLEEKELEQSSASTKSTESSTTEKVIIKNTKNIQVERKIRTFKIVVGLMLAFVVCRLPYWIYYVVKLFWTLKGAASWNTHYSVVTINLLNCAFNPFLYTFLNVTIAAMKTVNEFFWKILCCCFSNAEFEEFEKENPFMVDYPERRPPRVVMEHRKQNVSPQKY